VETPKEFVSIGDRGVGCGYGLDQPISGTIGRPTSEIGSSVLCSCEMLPTEADIHLFVSVMSLDPIYNAQKCENDGK